MVELASVYFTAVVAPFTRIAPVLTLFLLGTLVFWRFRVARLTLVAVVDVGGAASLGEEKLRFTSQISGVVDRLPFLRH